MNVLAWWNLLFELPILAACLLSFTAALGGEGHHGGHAAGHDHDGDSEVHHETDAGDGHGHHGSHGGWVGSLVALPGGDRAPLSLVMVILCLAFGFIGLGCNLAFATILSPVLFIWPSLAIAAGGSLLVSRTFARAFSRVLPRVETYALGRDACVGSQATVTALLSATEAYVQLYDPHKNLLEVRVRTAGDTPLAQGMRVILLAYDEANSSYTAEPFDPDAPAPAETARAAGESTSRTSDRPRTGDQHRRVR